MSIFIQNINKSYGNQKALSDVSLEIENGEIVGFLGPNGAGKSTLMKIISSYISQDSGTVKVCKFNTIEQENESKKRIGYLPENNPLYKEMYIKEYLNFVASIYKIEDKKQRIEQMIQKVGLQSEQYKTIGELSKGYQQRVGLVAALLHNPEVLILDEPTTGLDPNQLEEVRKLIKEVGKDKTVLLSTHILQEVEKMCNRVVIINKGEIVSDKLISEYKKEKLDIESHFQSLCC
jgi:ABC-2 type transport system ATP-binding protein